MLHLYDMANYSRRRFETGIGVSSVFYEIAYQTNPSILVWDGDYHNMRRRKIFPDYKMNRKEPPEDMRDNQKFLREMLQLTKWPTFQVHYWEADDVIAALARQEKKPCYVVSTDMDFYQLPNVRTEKDPEKVPVPSCQIRLYKALVGDTSDNIKGIPNFGIAAYKALDWDRVEVCLDAPMPFSFDFLKGLGFKDRHASWLQEQANWDLIRAYYEIIGFIEIPEGELIQGLTPGVENIAAATEIFKRYMI